MALTVRPLLAAELPWANACYAGIGFLPSSAADFVAVAEADGVKLGLGRLVAVDADSGELGGMYVLPAHRGHKVASAIVDFLLQHSPYRRLYCIPFARLEAFYRGFGFAPVPADATVPPAIAHKSNWCVQTYPDPVSLLVRMV